MCYQCWERRDFPYIVNGSTKLAAKMIEHIATYSLVGSNLHIIIDDWNIMDMHIEACFRFLETNIHEATPEQLAHERKLLELLATLDEDERGSALAMASGFIRRT